ncbi:DUF2288 family protein [Halobacteriovorax sp. HLS]|uniref:DUF2288 family protein n=1 Tax=Halobacteriovorax sp. HLS TaxID=2234000 RepID=UPI000FDA32C7|nr:DUF2288 family protein [Halobacteriovorax sp. HLS]
MENLKEKLSSEKEAASWKILEEHHEREALLIVDKELDLIEVGISIANDEVAKVKDWLTSQQLMRPDEQMVLDFAEDDSMSFEFIIIQPYVLAQKKEE